MSGAPGTRGWPLPVTAVELGIALALLAVIATWQPPARAIAHEEPASHLAVLQGLLALAGVALSQRTSAERPRLHAQVFLVVFVGLLAGGIVGMLHGVAVAAGSLDAAAGAWAVPALIAAVGLLRAWLTNAEAPLWAMGAVAAILLGSLIGAVVTARTPVPVPTVPWKIYAPAERFAP